MRGRITPANREETGSRAGSQPQHPDHPHARGRDFSLSPRLRASCGSPTHAWKRLRRISELLADVGSPTRTWMRRLILSTKGARWRITPTNGEETEDDGLRAQTWLKPRRRSGRQTIREQDAKLRANGRGERPA